ncbi:hypothetical protein Tco_1504981 [Tanacetum coccineum]
MDNASGKVHECDKCLKLKTELINKSNFIEKEIYNKLFKTFTTLEKHCISLEVDSQINPEIFQRDNSVSKQNAPSFDQLFELNELKAQSQEKDMVIKKLKESIKSLSGKMNEDKIKKDLKEIETINIELDHRVSNLIAENEHLKQTYKQLYDSIKPTCIRSKEQCDDIINQVDLKSVEIFDLNASLQKKVLVITALKDDLRKLKGKALVDNDVTKHPSDPKMLNIDMEPITPKLLNKKTAHTAYIKHTQEEATVLKDLVETALELLNKMDFIEKEDLRSCAKSFTSLEKHCISLDVDSQLNQEIFQRNNFVSNQSALSFDQLFELNELKAQSQEKDTVIKKLKERIKSLTLKNLFNTFDQYLIDELSEVQNVFHQMEQAVEQHHIVNIIVNSSVDNASVNVHECEKCLKLETELLNKKDFVEKEIYDKLFKSFTTLEKHCISLEVDTQLNQEIFQRDNSVSNQSAPSFDQLFELNELKAQSQEKDTVIKKLKERIKSLSGKMNEDKIKKDLEEIETINIELDHRVSKLIAENEHLKQTYKQLYDSIKPARIRSKEQCDDLINQVNLKSVEISDLNASLQEKVLVITALKDELRKLKGKDLADNVVCKHTIDPKMLKIDVEYLNPRLLNNRSAHSDYLKHTQEEAAILSINNSGDKLVDVIPKNKDKRVRFTELVTSSGNTNTKTASSSNLVSNKPMLSSTGVKTSTSASGSQPSGKTNKNKIQRTPSSTHKNKVEAHPRTVKYSLKNKNSAVEPKGTGNVQHSKLNANSEPLCVKCNDCMLFDNHDLCVLDFINDVNSRTKSKSVKKSSKRKFWKPTGKVITTTTEVPLRKPTALESDTPKPVVTLVYSRKPKKSKTNVSVSKSKALKFVIQIVLWYLDFGCSKHVTGDRSQLTNFVNKFLGTVKFGNDHVEMILGHGDYQIRNVTISSTLA